MSSPAGKGSNERSRQIRATMGAAAALFCGIFVLLGVQMALGDDPAVGPAQEASKARTHQKAQGAGEPVLPPGAEQQHAEPGYADPRRNYEQPYEDDGYYEQAPQGYGPDQQYQQPDYQQQYQQPQQQYAPPVQSGPS